MYVYAYVHGFLRSCLLLSAAEDIHFQHFGLKVKVMEKRTFPRGRKVKKMAAKNSLSSAVIILIMANLLSGASFAVDFGG
jgi:hypothetical protein